MTFLERKPDNFLMAWSPTVEMLAEKLGCTKHDIWCALFANNKTNKDFDKQIRGYLKEHHVTK